MQLKPLLLGIVSIYTFSAFSQDFKTLPGYRFSKEDQHEILLEKSKSQKTKAIIAITGGPVLMGIGALIVSKSGPTLQPVGGGFSVRKSDGEIVGGSIAAFGMITTLTSIPFFISSTKARREAALLLKNESTSFLKTEIAVPGITLRVRL